MNYQYTSARSHPRGGPMNDSRRRKRVHNYEEDEHMKKLRRERLYWEENEWRAPQQSFVVDRRRFEGPRNHMHYPPVSGGMGWLHTPPDPPNYFHMAPQMSRRQPPSVHQLHSYEYAPCHLNHPLFPKITPRQPVSSLISIDMLVSHPKLTGISPSGGHEETQGASPASHLERACRTPAYAPLPS